MVDDSHFITGSDNGNIYLVSGEEETYLHGKNCHVFYLGPLSMTFRETDEELKKRQLQSKKLLQHLDHISLRYSIFECIHITGSWVDR
nr:BPK_HP1_G0058390.mRNA.1.CDS.1 [Saccharomyces cerevisiae]